MKDDGSWREVIGNMLPYSQECSGRAGLMNSVSHRLQGVGKSCDHEQQVMLDMAPRC